MHYCNTSHEAVVVKCKVPGLKDKRLTSILLANNNIIHNDSFDKAAVLVEDTEWPLKQLWGKDIAKYNSEKIEEFRLKAIDEIGKHKRKFTMTTDPSLIAATKRSRPSTDGLPPASLPTAKQ